MINKSIYSIAELKGDSLKKFRIIANLDVILLQFKLLIPLFKKKLISLKDITIDSKSGYSGAGKNYKSKFKFKNFYLSILTC